MACQFISCDFPKAHFNACHFDYSKFSGCLIPIDEMKENLPRKINIPHALTHSLLMAAEEVGDWSEAAAYRRAHLKFAREHYWKIIVGADDWYKQHYSGKRLSYIGVKAVSELSNFIWRDGTGLLVLLRNATVFIIFYPAVLLSGRDSFLGVDGGAEVESYVSAYYELLIYTFATFVSLGSLNEVRPASLFGYVMTALPSMAGLVFGGLLVAMLINWMIKK
jgi:hypothetical protein